MLSDFKAVCTPHIPDGHVDMEKLPVQHKHLFVLRKLEVAPKSIQSVAIHFKIGAAKLRFNLLQTSRFTKIVVLMSEQKPYSK